MLGLGTQVLAGFGAIEMAPYLGIFLWTGLPLLVLGVLAIGLQTLSPNKYLGMLLTAGMILVVINPLLLGLEHPLLQLGRVPGGRHSDMNGFGPQTTAFPWFLGYWGSLALLSSLGAQKLWKRGASSRILDRLRARESLTGIERGGRDRRCRIGSDMWLGYSS